MSASQAACAILCNHCNTDRHPGSYARQRAYRATHKTCQSCRDDGKLRARPDNMVCPSCEVTYDDDRYFYSMANSNRLVSCVVCQAANSSAGQIKRELMMTAAMKIVSPYLARLAKLDAQHDMATRALQHASQLKRELERPDTDPSPRWLSRPLRGATVGERL